jgi:hypothetical protein
MVEDVDSLVDLKPRSSKLYLPFGHDHVAVIVDWDGQAARFPQSRRHERRAAP